MAAIEVLLLEDVHELGRAGDVRRVTPGFARNFLFPKGVAIVADKNTLRKRELLQVQRAQQAALDLAESEKLASLLNNVEVSCTAKVDPAGHMYGSVSSSDVLKLFEKQGFHLDKHVVRLAHPIKETGLHTLTLHFKEGVTCQAKLLVLAENAPQVAPASTDAK